MKKPPSSCRLQLSFLDCNHAIWLDRSAPRPAGSSFPRSWVKLVFRSVSDCW